MKDKTFKIIITGIITFFVFSSASWGFDNYHQKGRNHHHKNSSNYTQKNHGYNNNHGKKDFCEHSKQRHMNHSYCKKNKRWHKRYNHNKYKNACCRRGPNHVHFHNHYCLLPYSYIISSGVFCSPGWSFSFSTNGRW